jgi:hypothetical protein
MIEIFLVIIAFFLFGISRQIGAILSILKQTILKQARPDLNDD